MKIKNKQNLYSLLLLIGVALSFSLSVPYPFILIAAILAYVNPKNCILIILIIPLIEGYLNLDFEALIPVESFMIIVLFPLLLWNVFSKKPKLQKRGKLFFVLFGLLIIYGVFLAFFQKIYLVTPEAIWNYNLVSFSRIIFCLTFCYFLVGLKRDSLLNGLEEISKIAPWIIALIGVYFLSKSEFIGYVRGYYDVQGITHGEFSAVLSAFSVFIFYNIFNKRNVWLRLLNILSLIFLCYILLQMGSRNGLVSMSFVIVLCTSFFYIKGRPLRVVITAIVALFMFSYFLSKIVDTPAIQRVTFYNEESTVDYQAMSSGRLGFWQSAVSALWPEGFITGYGGTPLASKWITHNGSSLGSTDSVLHNTPLEFLVQYGIMGFLLYIALVFTLIRHFLFFYEKVKYGQRVPTILMVPFICCFSLLFSGMFLSWQWNSYWWYQVVVVFAIIQLFRPSFFISKSSKRMGIHPG